MPELPEVQSTVEYLSSRISGCLIQSCRILWARTIATHSPKTLTNLLVGKRISKVSRRGKYIVINLEALDHNAALLIHLRMSGSVEVVSNAIERDPYDRVIISLDNEKELRFNDVRKFGKMYFCNCADTYLQKLGIEPLSKDFKPDMLVSMISRKKGAIKPLLLNQGFIAGIGNIYADESLWLAKIHPTRLAQTIKKNEVLALHSAIIQVLEEAILLKGTDNGDYVVEGGMYQPKVYGRGKENCPSCGTKISRIVVGQRGTHFCGKCQKV